MNDKRLELARRLEDLPKPSDLRDSEAKVIAYLEGQGWVKTLDIELETNLAQPTISLAISRLKDRDWIKERTIEKEGRGFASKEYRLKTKWLAEVEFKNRKYIKTKEYNLRKIRYKKTILF